MDYQILLLFSSTFLLLLSLKVFFSSEGRKTVKLPPGPKPWPIVGNLFQLSSNPHHSLALLSKTHGPLMTLKLGSVITVVVSSSDMAREVFLKHDLSFSSRKIPNFGYVLNHHKFSIGLLPVSPKWRKLRKICALELFTKKSLDATELIRHDKVRELCEYVEECCRNGQVVDISKAAFTTLLNLLSNTFFSIDLVSQSSETSQELKGVVWDIMEAWGKPRLADYFPVLGYFDLFGTRKKLETSIRKFFAIFDDIIEQKLSVDSSSSSDKGDVLTTLLKISKEDGDLSLDDIKHFLLDMFLAGTDTSSAMVEWALTELLHNPSKMEKAKAELYHILGKDYGFIRESDIQRLPYLQAVVKETMRLHPTGPLLVPHKAEKAVDLCGYIVPTNSMLLVNAWAISRDPSLWDNPIVFSPERFLESEIDFRGQHFEYLPFGSGRRMCPAVPLASRMMHLMLANLLHTFNWKVEDGVRVEDIDFTEKFGLSVQKSKPLLAVPIFK